MLPLTRPRRCPECLVGTLRPARSFYCQWSNGHFITAPDFSSWVCDVCGWREYEREAVLDLQTLIDLNLPQPNPRVARARHPGDESADPQASADRQQP
jgi:hypothetical protein